MANSEVLQRTAPSAAIQDGARFLRRRYPRIVLTALACAVLAALIGQSLEPRYRGTAELLIERVPVADPEDATVVNAMDESSFIDGQVLVLQSSDLLRQVIEDYSLLDDPEIAGLQDPPLTARLIRAVRSLFASADDAGGDDPEDPVFDAVQRLRNMISVIREGRSTVISVTAIANGPDKAALIANAVTDTYINRQNAVQAERAEQVAARLNTRLSEVREQLLAAEGAVESFRAQSGVIGTEAATLSEQQLSELNAQLVQTRADLYQRQAVLERAQNLLNSGGDVYSLRDLMDSQLLSDLRLKLLDATSRESELVDLLGDSNPALDQVRAEKGDLEAQISAEIDRLINMLANEVEVTRAREDLLVNAVREAGETVLGEAEGEVELRELERIASSYATQYQRLLDRVGTAAALVAPPSSDARVISPAVAPNGAFFPPNKMIVVLGLIMGAGLGLLWALAKESMNTGVVTSQQAEAALGLPVLAAIPQFGSASSPRDVVMREPMSPFAESVRTLRHLVLSDLRADGAPVLQIASATAGEGKTTVAISLATSAAGGGQRVLLIDADLRQQGMTRAMGLAGRAGLTDIDPDSYRLGKAVSVDPESGIHVLPAGSGTASPPDFLESGRMRAILDWARANFDLVVVDSPEVGGTVDSIILARQSDLVLFVVRWRETPIDIIAKSMARLGEDKIRGVALNAVNEEEAATYGDSTAQFARRDRGMSRWRALARWPTTDRG